MKFSSILFLNSMELDFLQEIVFSGLYKRLGKRITEYPAKKNYYISMGYPNDISYVQKSHNSANFVSSVFGKHDIIILGSCKAETLKYYYRLLLISSNIRKMPAILIDGGDSIEVGGDAPEYFKKICNIREFDCIFKREMKHENINHKVFSLSLGVNIDAYARYLNSVKDYDICYAARATNNIREEVYGILKNMCLKKSVINLEKNKAVHNTHRTGLRKWFQKRANQIKKIVGIKKYNSYLDFNSLSLPPSQYLDMLGKSRVGISLPGAGFDTFRYWEIPALGALLFSLVPNIYVRDNFIDEENAIFFKSINEIAPKLKKLLQNKERIRDLAERGFEHVRKYHTDIHRADFVLNTIDKLT